LNGFHVQAFKFLKLNRPQKEFIMAIAITEEHQEIARVARKFLTDNKARGASRAVLETDADSLPPFWKQLVELG